MDLGLKDRVAIVHRRQQGAWPRGSRGAGGGGCGGGRGHGQERAEAEQVVRGLLDKGSRAVAVQADVTQAADVQRLVETALKTFGRPGPSW